MSKTTTRKLYDADGGVIREVILSDAADPYSIQGFAVSQDCTDILKNVAVMRDAAIGPRRNGRVLAEVPVAVVDQWFRDGSIHDQAFIRSWLRNSENSAFRIDQGKI